MLTFAPRPKASRLMARARFKRLRRTWSYAGPGRVASSILRLQRTIGNRAVQRLLEPGRAADRVADRVMPGRGREWAHAVQQQTSQATIQRQPAPQDPFAPGGVYDQLNIVREGTLPPGSYKREDSRERSFEEWQSQRFERKLRAIKQLGELRDERAVVTLVALVEDKLFVAPKDFEPDQKLRLKQEAVTTLGKIGGRVALAKLNDLLKSKDPVERMMAARALPGAAGAQAATDLLTALKRETDAGLKAQIIVSLGNASADLGNLREKEAIVTELIRQMENNRDVVHLAAINVLGKLRLPSATEPLLKQLTKSHGDVVLATALVHALGQIGDARAVPLVVVMLEVNVKASVRSEAALALGKIGGSKARAALQRRLKLETDNTVKADILKALTTDIHWTFRSAPSLP